MGPAAMRRELLAFDMAVRVPLGGRVVLLTADRAARAVPAVAICGR